MVPRGDQVTIKSVPSNPPEGSPGRRLSEEDARAICYCFPWTPAGPISAAFASSILFICLHSLLPTTSTTSSTTTTQTARLRWRSLSAILWARAHSARLPPRRTCASERVCDGRDFEPFSPPSPFSIPFFGVQEHVEGMKKMDDLPVGGEAE